MSTGFFIFIYDTKMSISKYQFFFKISCGRFITIKDLQTDLD
jgi:hypothetical protein